MLGELPIRCLEDLGYETIDNLPISLVSRVVAPGMPETKIAIGLDTRTRFTAKVFWTCWQSYLRTAGCRWVYLSRHPTRFWYDSFRNPTAPSIAPCRNATGRN